MIDAAADADMAKNILLMTATITPSSDPSCNTMRADPDLRRKDYEDALRFYLNLSSNKIDGILFCENSGADLGSLREIAEKENPRAIPVELFSTVCDAPEGVGKGHAELLLMDRAFEKHIAEADRSTRFWKITGRLIIRNLSDLIASAPDDFWVYIDLRLFPDFLRAFGANRWADTRIFSFTPDGYRKYFLGKREVVGTPGHPLAVELALFDGLFETYEAGGPLVPRFQTQPIISGVCAGTLKDYDDLAGQTKNLARLFARKVAPSLWI